ncbi:MAG: helix-turn-helix transcriptional regulator [Candidatus Bathyarchaeota archaeon]|nr:MAG: helix-turn-helix transcriptional regulator [Candidatus Bathyarchaeota archaeon]
MRTEDLKKTVLKMFGGREFYGYEVHKILLSRDVDIEISRLYRVLTEMMREGLLEGRWEKSRKGPKRRIYKIGEKGRDELDKMFLEAIQIVHMFYGKYLMGLVPKVNVLDIIYSPLTEGLEARSNVACVTPQYTPMHGWFVQTAHGISPQGQIYLIKPKLVEIDLNLENLTVMNGSYSDISLREGLLDLLVIVDLPRKNSLEAALKEWHRVLKPDGKLGIVTPSILLQEHEDPLTIGDFVEKYEHETIERGEKIDRRFLQTQLKSFFTRVKERQIVHMAVIQASPRKHASTNSGSATMKSAYS